MIKVSIFLFTLLCWFGFTQVADSHPGRTNRSGCHNNRKTGGYHCHDESSGGSEHSSPSTPSELYRPQPTVEPSLNSPSINGKQFACGSPAGSFGSIVFVVYVSPERLPEIQEVCKDAFLVNKPNGNWVQVATFNNEDDAKALAENLSGWYAKLSLNGTKSFEKYCNLRYGFCAQYPTILQQGPAPANGDGRQFYSLDGLSITLYGESNIDGGLLQKKLDEQANYFDLITYRYLGKGWFVLSGYQGDKILYLKTYVGNRSNNILFIQYPAILKRQYDTIVSRVSNSFKPGKINGDL